MQYSCNIGKVNYLIKIDLKITCETDMNRLFECNSKNNVAKITFHDAPFIQCEQIWQYDNSWQYCETIMAFEKLLRMSIQKIPLEKSYKMIKSS